MRRLAVVLAVLLLAATGCGRRIGTDTEFDGEITRQDDSVEDLFDDAEMLLLAEGRPIDGGSPCAEFGLAPGRNIVIEVTSRDFDPVAVAFDRDGAVIAVGDDWDDETDSRLVLGDIPRGAKLAVFALDGSGGEYELVSTEASEADIEEFAACTDLSLGTLKGDLIEDKDDEPADDLLSDELDAFLYVDGYNSARIHPFDVDAEQLVSLVLESQDFDPVLALVEIDGDEYDYVIHNDDYSGSLSSRIDQVLEPGRYAAVIIPYASGTEGSYTLSLECYEMGSMEPAITDVEGPGITATAGVAAGSNLAITIWPGISTEKPYDVLITAATPCAFFGFTIDPGEAGLYDLSATSGDLDTYLCLLSMEGGFVSCVGSNDDFSGSDAGLTKMLSPGEYVAIVTSYSGTEEGEVGFRYETADTQPALLTPGRPVDAELGWASPELYYNLEIMAGSIYLVSASSDAIDPWVEAVLPDGTILSDDDSGGYPNALLRLDPTPAQSGTALITVKDYSGGATGALRIEVTQQRRSESEIFALYD
ncbi:MAG: hypothetical protein QUS11_10655 [Candidatus Fermentibacter sp.]|nr:hypothetical protein [Candidatus Fermentibacter sp.]